VRLPPPHPLPSAKQATRPRGVPLPHRPRVRRARRRHHFLFVPPGSSKGADTHAPPLEWFERTVEGGSGKSGALTRPRIESVCEDAVPEVACGGVKLLLLLLLLSWGKLRSRAVGRPLYGRGGASKGLREARRGG